MRKLTIVLIAALSVVTAACFDVEQTLTLEKNMSGTAGLTMTLDMEPMAGFLATMKHSMSGKEGLPNAEDIEAARKEMLSSMKRSKTVDPNQDKKEIEQALPSGVRLLDVALEEDGLKIGGTLKLGFDQASKLADIKLQSKGAAPAGAPIDNPMESPFGGLQVIDEGRTLLITSPTRNPVGDQKADLEKLPPLDEAMKAQLASMLKDLRVAFKITAPFDIVEHNAHRKEGNTLIWDYRIGALEKMTPDQLKQGIKVRYRK